MISIVSIFGFLFALFLPGFFITLIFFREVKFLERLLLSITFSIMLAIAIGIGLGYDRNVAQVTGGITPYNVWRLELAITGVLALVAAAVNFSSIRKLKFRKPKPKIEEEEVTFKKL